MTNKELETKLNELISRVEKLENKSSGKITLEEFFASDKDLAIHCDTEEKASTLLRAFDRMGKTWDNGKSYLKENYFEEYGEDTCYFADGWFADIDYCESNYIKIYEFEDIILTEEPKWQFTENEKKLLSLVDEKFKWIARDGNCSIYLYVNKPIKENYCWDEICANSFELVVENFSDTTFDCIKWTDTEPCEFRKYI